MLASPLSIMVLAVPLSSIYSKYIAQQQIYRMQLSMPENVRYLIDDCGEFSDEDEKLHTIEMIDATEQINESLKRFGSSRQLQDESHRRQILGKLDQQWLDATVQTTAPERAAYAGSEDGSAS